VPRLHNIVLDRLTGNNGAGALPKMGESKHETRAEYDVTSPILGKAPAPICCFFAESLDLAYSTALSCDFSRKRLYGLLINWNLRSDRITTAIR